MTHIRLQNSNYRPWSDGEIATLERLIKQGFSYAQIARDMGRSMGSIYAGRKRLGVSVIPTQTGQILKQHGLPSMRRLPDDLSGWTKADKQAAQSPEPLPVGHPLARSTRFSQKLWEAKRGHTARLSTDAD